MGGILRGREGLIYLMSSNAEWASAGMVRAVLNSSTKYCMRPLDPCSYKASAIHARWKQAVSVDFLEVQCPDPLGILQGICGEQS